MSKELSQFVAHEFNRLANPAKAVEMAAYMKTEMPFYGVQKPDRLPIYKQMIKRFAPGDQKQYKENVLSLWHGAHREEKYAALEYACAFKQYANTDALPLFQSLVREGAWWDFVDVIATHLVGNALLKERSQVSPVLNQWIADDDMWLRRTAILAHNHHKKQTDERQLFGHILQRASEREFFIRKAIGWALREYSYANPDSVRMFILENKVVLSPLSVREGAKALIRSGKMKQADLIDN